MPSLAPSAVKSLKAVLDQGVAAHNLPGTGFTVCSPEGVIFEHYAGNIDVMNEDPAAPKADKDTIFFFASTTKLLTSVAVLQLAEKGVLNLKDPASKFLPQLKTPLRIYTGTSESGKAEYKTTDTEIEIWMLMNQSSGFGAEFAEKVVAWKNTLKEGERGKGFVNSCKIDNLVHTPIVYEPGTMYEYGNSAEWLGLLIQNATGLPLEKYMQKNIFEPLGMRNTGFYPFSDEDKAKRLMPLRWKEGDKYEELVSQFRGLTLPRVESEIEYPVGGGGIFSNPTDYLKILRYILSNYLSPGSISSPQVLSESSIKSLFEPTLPATARKALAESAGPRLGNACEEGDMDWSTGMALYLKKERKAGWGRRTGSAGWFGAGGTEYWIDPKSGVACCFSTNMLPFMPDAVIELKETLEKTLYENLSE